MAMIVAVNTRAPEYELITDTSPLVAGDVEQ